MVVVFVHGHFYQSAYFYGICGFAFAPFKPMLNASFINVANDLFLCFWHV